MTQPSTPATNEFTVLLNRPLTITDCRAAQRYPCAPATLVQLHLTGTAVQLGSWASDLSEGGIGLALPYPLDEGTPIVVRLRGRRPTRSITMPGRVVHCTEQDGGIWRINCAFEWTIEPEALQALL
jgi:hypothetical protein